MTFAVTPGPQTVFGPVEFKGLTAIDDTLLRRQLSFRPGQIYRARQIALPALAVVRGALAAWSAVKARMGPPKGARALRRPEFSTYEEGATHAHH